jgi:hypothetical protein
MALPDDLLHRRYVERLRPALDELKIGIFWIAGPEEVRLDAAWAL